MMDMNMRAVESGAGLAPKPEGFAGSALSSLAHTSLAGRFCAWRGGSSQRYVASVYPVDRGANHGGLPHFDGVVLIAVAARGLSRRIVSVTAIDRASEARGAVASGLARGVDEWHVHFLADDCRSRAAVAADLSSRHIGPHRA